MLNTLISLYAPHHCLGCQTEGALLCTNCIEALPRVAERCYRCRALSPGGRTCLTCRRSSKLYAVHVATKYRGEAKELVGRLKFSGARAAAESMARAMCGAALTQECLIVPVPTATSRVRLRGYNQATLIGKALAHLLRHDFSRALVRMGQHRQVGASRRQRLEQMEGSFIVRNPEQITGRYFLLVDDVMTTGATLESAAAVLKAAGAKRVEAVVFARA